MTCGRARARQNTTQAVSEVESNKDNKAEEEEEETTEASKYQKMLAKIPKPFRDHCPDCYSEH